MGTVTSMLEPTSVTMGTEKVNTEDVVLSVKDMLRDLPHIEQALKEWKVPRSAKKKTPELKGVQEEIMEAVERSKTQGHQLLRHCAEPRAEVRRTQSGAASSSSTHGQGAAPAPGMSKCP